tara:strand:- start:1261 stop:1605 length:345 start_codon:yes stop_codon:yes gene_type:complete
MPNSKQLSLILNKVEKWLKDEVNQYKRISKRIDEGEDPINVCDAPEIFFGRNECAEGLLSQIAKWRKEYDDVNVLTTMTIGELEEERRKNPEKYLSQETINEMKELGLPIRRGK